jgi:mannose-6-phosphate isomerase-like protein (cupin superfamily)
VANIVGKVWGDTSVLIQNSLVELHKINIKAGYRCSEHKHEHKWNGFYVISGVLEIHVSKNDYKLTDITVLRAGDFTTVRPGEFHKFVCVEDCVALELYYPEALSEDIVRKDHGGATGILEALEDDVRKMVTSNKSPCVSVCKTDPVTMKCVGCGRTLSEIEKAGRLKIDIDSALDNIPYDVYDK